MLEAARRRGEGMRPVVYASSIAAVADDGGYPSTLYGVFKLANEGTAARYFSDFGVSSVGLRPHTLYGPGRDQGLTSAPTAAMVAAAKGEEFRIPFGGSLQLQYTADAGEAFVRASEADAEGASVHNLDGPVASVEEIIAAIEQAAPSPRGGSPPNAAAAVPLLGRLGVVHRAGRRAGVAAADRGRRGGDREVPRLRLTRRRPRSPQRTPEAWTFSTNADRRSTRWLSSASASPRQRW